MSWQFFISIYLLLTTVSELLRRRLGQAIPQYNRLVNAFFFVCIHFPSAIVVASFVGFNLAIGWLNALLLFAGGIAFALSGMLMFRASKDVSAGLFGILNNFAPVITITFAALLLSQRLNHLQLLGALIIIFSALSVSIICYQSSSKNTRIGILIALLSVTLMGMETVYESWMMKRIGGFGTYLLLGIGSQTFWMAVFAWPQRKLIRKIINRKYGLEVFILSVAKSVKGLAFIAALYLSKNASIVGAFVSFLPIMVVVAGYLFLGEKNYLKAKIAAAVSGSAGLLILSLNK